MSDEEEDPKHMIEEACKPNCIKPLLAYQECVKRIQGKHEAHCTGQYFDYWHCVDKEGERHGSGWPDQGRGEIGIPRNMQPEGFLRQGAQRGGKA